ncbi:MAG: FAD-dependent oxidoreductase [Gammaproteobacteria bacterium]|nr:FAD-dependent oxidoreductase [Gammaproteobacteria bacterium]
MAANNDQRDLVILGGGVGGLIIASVAGQLGLKVTLIEKTERLGGDCLHYGCVPSKTLIQSAKVASLMRRGEEFGLPRVAPEVELGRVMKHVADVIAVIQKNDDPERFRGYGCEVIFGGARFLDAHRVEVNGKTITGRRFVIATGSSPAVPPVDGIGRVEYLTNETVFSHDHLPGRLLVLGGGPIGVELAQAFLRLGSQVVLVQRNRNLLPKEDADIAIALREQLVREGMEIHTEVNAERIQRKNGSLELACSGGLNLEGDTLLIASGRKPNIEALDLNAAGVAHDKRGITVDPRLRTSQKHIFGCGDVCGPFPFTHMAEYQAGIVISNAVFRWPKKMDYSVVPWVTYTDPEVGRVGLSEAQAYAAYGERARVSAVQMSAMDRPRCAGEPEGFVKLVAAPGRVLRGTPFLKLVGMTAVCTRGGELIGEGALAMRAGMLLARLAQTIHAYPTWSIPTRFAAASFFGDFDGLTARPAQPDPTQ